jgi:hypothetical protein
MKIKNFLAAAVCLGLFYQTQANAETDLKTVMSKLDTTLYGRVKFDANYDTAEFVNYNDFIGAVKGGGGSGNHSTNFNPRDSRIGLAVAHDDDIWLSEARIEGDFYGTNAGNNLIPRMRLGYVKVTNKEHDYSILAGQDWIPIATLNPPTVEFGILSAAGNLWWRVPQVTLRKEIDELQLTFSLMEHRRVSTDEKDQRMPWLLSRVAYIDGPTHLALGGGWRTGELEDEAGMDERVQRWLLAAEFKYTMGDFTLMAEPWIGEGIDDEFLRYDLGINSSSGTPEAMMAWGGFAALSYTASDCLTLALGYGMDNPDDDDLAGIELNNRQFEMNQQTFVNAWYSLTSAVKVGAEVIYVRTTRPDFTNDGFRMTTSMLLGF